ncbi:uncharacterized protein [Dendropsophus ebraccatus]|uniref:uncharacterized protein n=1 Tax=Dendropsophus ebraccatus TaxID=150705 RepID=UPI0038317482
MVQPKTAAPPKQAGSETLILTISKTDGTIKIELPPGAVAKPDGSKDQDFGKLQDISQVKHVLCNPQGEMFCVRDGDLYRGPLLSHTRAVDWFTVGYTVGKWEWSQFKILSFHPNGELYGVTTDGELYEGPPPRNENVPWMCGQATQIGSSGWEQCEALFFDPSGNLFTVNDEGQLVKGTVPKAPQEYKQWLASSKVVGKHGWREFNHFMSFSPDGKLWCVDNEGYLYRGSIPGDSEYKKHAAQMGCGYGAYKFISFKQDKTIKGITSFKFLPEKAQTLPSNEPEVIENRLYDNRKSSCTLKDNLFEKTVKLTSFFSPDSGFVIEAGRRIMCEAGIPTVDDNGRTVKVDQSRNHNWNFIDMNETEKKLSHNLELTVPPGKAIRLVASVIRAELSVPYQAKVKTTHGFETDIEGTWKGMALYQLSVRQEDLK